MVKNKCITGRDSSPEVFYRMGISNSFVKATGKHL